MALIHSACQGCFALVLPLTGGIYLKSQFLGVVFPLLRFCVGFPFGLLLLFLLLLSVVFVAPLFVLVCFPSVVLVASVFCSLLCFCSASVLSCVCCCLALLVFLSCVFSFAVCYISGLTFFRLLSFLTASIFSFLYILFSFRQFYSLCLSVAV